MITTTLQMRIDKETKDKAQKVFRSAGLDMSSGTRLLLSQVVRVGKITLDDENLNFLHTSAKDVLDILGPFSKKEREYYDNL